MKKRFLSMVLCLCMVVGMLPALTIPAYASRSIADLQKIFPSGKYWNHYVNQVHESGDNLLSRGDNYFADFVSDYPCNYHYNYGGNFVGCYDCNYYYGLQCFGFARRMAFLYYDSNVSSWRSEQDAGLDSLKAGDVIDYNWYDYQGSDGKWYRNYGHTVWVTAVDGNKVTYADCNGESIGNPAKNCQIMWGRQCDKSNFNKSNHYTVWHAPYAATGGGSSTPSQPSYPTNAQNLGGDFYAYISYPNGNLNLENRSNNVRTVAKNTTDPRQIWHFIRQSNGSYEIVNMYDGRCLDLNEDRRTNGTNVQVWTDNDTTAQRWNIVNDAGGQSGSYNLLPHGENNYALDVDGADKSSGANVQIWDRNATAAQAFKITKISNVNSTLAYNLGSDFYARISFNGTYLQTTGGRIPDGNYFGMNVATTRSQSSDTHQIWHFMRQNNGSYKIVNEYNGWCLDTQTGIAENGKNVWTWSDDHGGNPERWYLMRSPGDSTYRIVSALEFPSKLYSVDICLSNIVGDGYNAQVYQQNEDIYQQFAITKVSYTPASAVTPSYIITASASPSAGGTVTGGGSYANGKSATVKAVANSGYTFKGWTENGGTVSTSANYTFTVSASRTLTAVFEKAGAAAPTVTAWPTAAAVNYGQTLAGSALPGGKASVSGTFKWNDSSLTPKAGQSYAVTFTPSDTAKYSTASGKVSVTVNKATPALSLSASQSGTSVTVDISASNPYNAALTDIPTPTVTYRIGNGTAQRVTGSSFTIPEGTANGTVITITASTAENGNYRAAEKSTTLTVSGTTSGTSYHILTTSSSDLGGSVSIQPASAKQGETVTVSATPRSGYRLEAVTATTSSGAAVRLTSLSGGRYTFTMPDSNVTLDAVFEATQDDWINPFSDIAKGAWYYDAVKFVSQNGLMNGSNGVFDHSGNLSRAMIAQILYNKEGKPETTGGRTFNDVAGSAWYADAISWAANKKLIFGDEKGLFSPNNPITREQLALILWRYEGSPTSSGGTLNFTDAGRVSSYAREAVSWAVANGIISGKGGGVLDPQGPATRAQVAQMLKNYFGP